MTSKCELKSKNPEKPAAEEPILKVYGRPGPGDNIEYEMNLREDLETQLAATECGRQWIDFLADEITERMHSAVIEASENISPPAGLGNKVVESKVYVSDSGVATSCVEPTLDFGKVVSKVDETAEKIIHCYMEQVSKLTLSMIEALNRNGQCAGE